MTQAMVVLFIAGGLVFLAVEFLIIPGFSLPGLVGLAMIGYGIFKATQAYGPTGAWIAVLVSVVAAAGLVWLSLKSRYVRKIALTHNQKGTRAGEDYTTLIGAGGRAVTPLRPAGTALIGDVRHDVVTDGEFIDSDAELRVVGVEGTRIIVTYAERGR